MFCLILDFVENSDDSPKIGLTDTTADMEEEQNDFQLKNLEVCACLFIGLGLWCLMPVISWWSVLLVEETGVPRESFQPIVFHWQTLSHNAVSSTPCHEWVSNSQL